MALYYIPCEVKYHATPWHADAEVPVLFPGNLPRTVYNHGDL